MTEAWPFVCQVLADPVATRAFIDQLQRLPAAVRAYRAPDDEGDPGVRDLEHSRLWLELAREAPLDSGPEDAFAGCRAAGVHVTHRATHE